MSDSEKKKAAEKLLQEISENYLPGLFKPLEVIQSNLDHCVECPHFKTDCPNCPTCSSKFYDMFDPDCDCLDPDAGPDIRATRLFYGKAVRCPEGKFK